MNRTATPTIEELLALRDAQLETQLDAIAALTAENTRLSSLVAKLEAELALARMHRYAPRSEKSKDRLLNEAEQAAAEAAAGIGGDHGDGVVPDTGLPDGGADAGARRGRKRLPASLPRQRVEYTLPEDKQVCPCCSNRLHRIGETVTEQLHIEVRVTVLENARAKYACRHCDRTGIQTPVLTAPMPVQPLPGSVATPSTLAFALVHKFVDGTPFYRLAEVFARAGVPISRGTLAHWVIGASQTHLQRIHDALKARLVSQELIHGDETTVQVLKEDGRAASDKSYMWAYRSGEQSAEPIVLLDYQPGRGQIHPQTFLGSYSGLLMSDGYSAWRSLQGATHLGCMAHARRRFVDAQKTRGRNGGLPDQALQFFQRLYKIEAEAQRASLRTGESRADCLHRYRQQHSLPVLTAFKDWLTSHQPNVLPDSQLGDAVAYTLNQWDYLTRYVQDGRRPIDNNLLERDIRVFATGRKSWLFSDTVAGAKASAVIYSLMLTCRACGIEPFAWLSHVLTEMPRRGKDADIADLLPFNFKKPNA
jgi:transposase